MKKFRNILKVLLTVCFVIMSAMLVTACGSGVDTPENVRVTDELNLTWYAVKGADSYDISIKCTKLNFSHPVSDELKAELEKTVGVETQKSSRKAIYNIENLSEGDYEFKVRAVVAGRQEKLSAWSKTLKYHKNYSTGCEYHLINGGTEYTIKSAGNASGDVYIEDTYLGKPVTQISLDAFKNNPNVENIYVGKNVKSIGSNAFSGCTKLKKVVIPEGVTSLGTQVFGLTTIESIELPNTITVIPENTFYNCRSLTSVKLGNAVTKIGVMAFKGCSALEELTLPETLKTIDEYAFHLCRGLKSITIPESVTTIGQQAFYNNENLEEVNIPVTSKLKVIASETFVNCKKLKSFTIPNNIQQIQFKAFFGCEALETTNIPATVVSIGSDAFAKTKIFTESKEHIIYIDDWVIGVSDDAKNLDEENPDTDYILTKVDATTLKEGTKGIAAYAFSNCVGIKTVSLPNSVKYLNSGAFANCVNLYNVATRAGSLLEQISANAFNGCSISTLKLSSDGSLTYIGDYAFANNKTLDNNAMGISIIPSTVTRIGSYAFSNTALYTNALVEYGGNGVVYAGDWLVGFDPSAGLSNVVIPEEINLVGIADYAFSLCSTLRSVEGMRHAKYIGQGAFYQCKALALASLNYSVKEIKPYTFYECEDLYTIEFPEDLAVIGRSAFYRCISLDKLDLSQTKVNSISEYSFYRCANIKTIKFNPELVAINNYAFYGCESLGTVTIPKTVTYLGDRPFAACTNLADITIEMPITKVPDRMFYKCEGLKNIVLPDTVTEIGKYAFYNCSNLEKIKLNKNVERIGDYAFYGTKNLHDIYLPQSLTYIGKYAFKGAYNLRSVYLSNKLENVNMYAFYGAKNVTFYVENGAKTEDWHLRWNPIYRPVIYNCTLSEDKTSLVSVTVGTVDNANGIGNTGLNNFQAPKKKGYTFTGWTTNEGSVAESNFDAVINGEKGTVLYPCWKEGEEEVEILVEKPKDDNPGDSSGDTSSGNPPTSGELSIIQPH